MRDKLLDIAISAAYIAAFLIVLIDFLIWRPL